MLLPMFLILLRIIGTDNGLATKRPTTINHTNDDPAQSHKCESVGQDFMVQ